jgi:hypothetical protein
VPDADRDAAKAGYRPFSFEFERNLSFWSLVGFTERKLFRNVVELHHDAVDPVRKRGPLLLGLQVPLPDLLRRPRETRSTIESHLLHYLRLLRFSGAQWMAGRIEYAEGENLKQFALTATFPARDAHAAVAWI